jgi:hypothetical protein
MLTYRSHKPAGIQLQPKRRTYRRREFVDVETLALLLILRGPERCQGLIVFHGSDSNH